MSVQVPFPPSGSYLQAIRESSRRLREDAGILITPESIKQLIQSPAFTTSFKRVSANHGLAMPLKFSSPLDELNLLAILSLLNFASGYRIPLHAQCGRGSWDSIRALAFAMYITSSSGDNDMLSAKGMKAVDAAKIADLMGIQVHVERPHESIPGVTVGTLGGPLYELVKLIASVLNETGSILVNSGYPNLGAFVAEALKEAENAQTRGGSDIMLEIVLEKLVRAFPAFQDMAEIHGRPIYCFKKALFLIHAINIRFGSMSPSPFPIPSTAHSPVFTDNVLPSMLIHLGVIDISHVPELASLFPEASSEESLSKLLEANPASSGSERTIPVEGPSLNTEQSYTLRAAAIDACELVVGTARTLDSPELSWIKDITLPDVDMWIWGVAKDRPDYRRLPRFILTNTVFF